MKVLQRRMVSPLSMARRNINTASTPIADADADATKTTKTPRYPLPLLRHIKSREKRSFQVGDVPYKTLVSISQDLKHYNLTDHRLSRSHDNSLVVDDTIHYKMQYYLNGARNHISTRLQSEGVQASWKGCAHISQLFPDAREKGPWTFNSLNSVYDYLYISDYRIKKVVRSSIADSAANYGTWLDALKTMMKELYADLITISENPPSKDFSQGMDAVSRCIKLLNTCDLPLQKPVPVPVFRVRKPTPNPNPNPDIYLKPTWGDVFKLLNVVTYKLQNVSALESRIKVIRAVKEGLKHINPVQLDHDGNLEDMQVAQSIIRSSFQRNLGNPCHCLFALFNFWLFKTVSGVTVDMAGRVYVGDDGVSHLCMGEIVTGEEDLSRALKHLHRALKLVNHVYHVGNSDASLQLEGHIWGVGIKESIINYENVPFNVHGI